MSESTRLVLVRHGQTVWHAENRYAGNASDIDLTDQGREQAQALARWAGARRFDALLVSPVRRAQETAAPVAAALGMTPEVVPALQEVDFGVAEGRTAEELLAMDPSMVRRFRADPAAHPFPSGDSPKAAADAAAEALRAAATRHPGGRVLVIAHNTLLRLAMCVLLDLPVGRYRQLFPRLETARLTELELPVGSTGTASLLSLNRNPDQPDASGEG